MSTTSSPYIDGAIFDAIFSPNGQPETVPMDQPLYLDKAGFHEMFSLHIRLDKGPEAKPLPKPCIALSIYDTYRSLTNSRSFLVEDFMNGNDQGFQKDLLRWMRADEGTAHALSSLFNAVRERVRPEMAEPLPEPTDVIKRRAYRF